MFQQNHTSHGHSPLNHFKPSMKRAAFQKRMGPLLLGAMVLMIVGAVTLHVGGPIFLFQTGFGAFSLNNPISSVLIGVFFVFALFKLKYVWVFLLGVLCFSVHPQCGMLC
jgi:hypothetical protein